MQIVFDGSGTATSTETDQSGGGSSDTDSFSWHAVYQLPLSDLSQYASGSSGWNDTGIQEDYAASTFSGTTNRSCSAPSGGSCVEPGGGTTCQGSFTNNNSVPLTLLALSPADNNVFTLAAPAYSANQPANNCFPVAIGDTCDPLYAGPYPGQGENTPVIAQFKLDTGTPQTAQPIPVSTNQSWSCASSGGAFTDTGNVSWKGTVTLGCSSGSTAVAAAVSESTSCCPSGPLEVATVPSEGKIANVDASRTEFHALANCGKPAYIFEWSVAYIKNRFGHEPNRYVTVTPTYHRESSSKQPGLSSLNLRLKCSPPASALGTANPWLVCWGDIKYVVDVTDANGHIGLGQIVMNWRPVCLTAEERQVLRERLRKIAEEILNALEDKFADQITGPLTVDKVIKWLEAEEAAPYFFVHDLTELGAQVAGLRQEAEDIKDQLADPNC